MIDKPLVDKPSQEKIPPKSTVVILGTNNPEPWKSEAQTKITDEFVQVSSLSLNVENASLFKAGDRIIIRHPSRTPIQ
ncbi:MAG: hypothetical protein HC846_05220 [Blastocatellia bacterium]|nr:hypothetical protein [Blastocatellia bacterium]